MVKTLLSRNQSRSCRLYTPHRSTVLHPTFRMWLCPELRTNSCTHSLRVAPPSRQCDPLCCGNVLRWCRRIPKLSRQQAVVWPPRHASSEHASDALKWRSCRQPAAGIFRCQLAHNLFHPSVLVTFIRSCTAQMDLHAMMMTMMKTWHSQAERVWSLVQQVSPFSE